MRYACLDFSRHSDKFFVAGEGEDAQFLKSDTPEWAGHWEAIGSPGAGPSSYWREKAKQVAWWTAQLVTGTEIAGLEMPKVDSLSLFPTQFSLRQLDHLATEGWRLVHVSEDRGLYTGEHAGSESYPVRVRYLLETSAPTEAKVLS